MKILLATIVLFVFNVSASGQVSISGKVVDKKNKPLEYATIVVKKDSITMANAFTDSMGNYTVQNVPTGSYNISCSFINDKIEILLNVNKDTIVNVQLNANKQLGQVMVAGKKPLIERKVDRLIFNVENSVTAIGGDALDALQKTPSIRVNNDNISMIGKSSISVMLNDRLLNLAGNDLINFLKSIKTEDIAQIEVITNPPAKYDAQGNSGLINIKTKNIKKNSFSGNIGGSYTQTTYPAGRFGSSINYQKNKWTLSAGFGIGQNAIAPIERMGIYYSTQTWYGTDNRKEYNDYISGRFNADYQISKSSSIGIQYMGQYFTPNMKGQNTIVVKDAILNTVDSTLITDAHTNNKAYYHSLNGHFQTKWDTTGKKLSVDVDYFMNDDNRERPFTSANYFSTGLPTPNSYKEYTTTGKQNIPIVTGKIDMEWPTKWASLSFGAKLSFTKSDNSTTLYNKMLDKYQIDTANSNEFQYQENIQALYVSANKSINKWSFQAGLRGEYTQTKGYSVNYKKTNVNEYFKLFPTAYISYQKNEDNTFALSYGQRIGRPNYWDLNPFRWFLNPYSYAEGNPNLQPSFNHNIELSHTYKNVLITSISFSAQTNGYDQIPIVSSASNLIVITRKNFLTAYTYNFSESYTFNKWRWLESTNQAEFYYKKAISNLSITYPMVEGVSAYIASNNSIIFNKNKTVLGAFNFWYQFPWVDGVNRGNNYYSIDLGLKILLRNKKLQIGINAADILKTNIGSRFYSIINNIKTTYDNYYDDRRFRISINYKFGNNNIKTNDRKLSNEEERNRAGK